jgi:hypothetical protein
MSYGLAVLITAGTLALAPPHLITKCADPGYRQAHLAECNVTGPAGHGGAGRRGLLGLGIGPL